MQFKEEGVNYFSNKLVNAMTDVHNFSVPNEDRQWFEDFLKMRGSGTKSKLLMKAVKEFYNKHNNINDGAPDFYDDKVQWFSYVEKLDKAQLKRFDSQVNMLLRLTDQKCKEFHMSF